MLETGSPTLEICDNGRTHASNGSEESDSGPLRMLTDSVTSRRRFGTESGARLNCCLRCIYFCLVIDAGRRYGVEKNTDIAQYRSNPIYPLELLLFFKFVSGLLLNIGDPKTYDRL